ncbi:hypothetical protein B0H10DRAFT_2190856 [Mycena sp. CBHHK59/15]|nr:hypothetical protein B0H10DRAFT_2190856 [Mycena sp. CBHHK59/15]
MPLRTRETAGIQLGTKITGRRQRMSAQTNLMYGDQIEVLKSICSSVVQATAALTARNRFQRSCEMRAEEHRIDREDYSRAGGDSLGGRHFVTKVFPTLLLAALKFPTLTLCTTNQPAGHSPAPAAHWRQSGAACRSRPLYGLLAATGSSSYGSTLGAREGANDFFFFMRKEARPTYSELNGPSSKGLPGAVDCLILSGHDNPAITLSPYQQLSVIISFGGFFRHSQLRITCLQQGARNGHLITVRMGHMRHDLYLDGGPEAVNPGKHERTLEAPFSVQPPATRAPDSLSSLSQHAPSSNPCNIVPNVWFSQIGPFQLSAFMFFLRAVALRVVTRYSLTLRRPLILKLRVTLANNFLHRNPVNRLNCMTTTVTGLATLWPPAGTLIRDMNNQDPKGSGGKETVIVAGPIITFLGPVAIKTSIASQRLGVPI